MLKSYNIKSLLASKNGNRTKSAPTHMIPTHRIILKIPNANLTNLFDENGELQQTNDNPSQNIIDNVSHMNNNINNSIAIQNAQNQNKAYIQPLTVNQTNNAMVADITGNLLLVRGNASSINESPRQVRPKTGGARIASATSQEKLNIVKEGDQVIKFYILTI